MDGENKTAVQELEIATARVATLTAEIADLRKSGDQAKADLAITQDSLRAEVAKSADLFTKLAKAEQDCATALKLAEEQQVRAAALEQKLAMNPDFIDVHGHDRPLTETNSASGVSVAWDAALRACGGDYVSAREKYPDAFAAYMQLQQK